MNPHIRALCDCHIPAQGHHFGTDLFCDGCFLPWGAHQGQRQPCPNERPHRVLPVLAVKYCSQCDDMKDIEQFANRNDRTQAWCRACCGIDQRRRRKERRAAQKGAA